MGRPRPTWAYHLTHVDHLASIARDGLVCDADAHRGGRLTREVGNQEVKARRRQKSVDIAPGGVVADYVPFYFTARNLMLYQIHTGRVPTYRGGQAGLVFLCLTLEHVAHLRLPWVVSDRNASAALAKYTDDVGLLDGHVDWPVASTSRFDAPPEDRDRPQRHQAELLVHRLVPWTAIEFIGARTDADLHRVEQALRTLDGYRPQRVVRPGWYF